MYASVLFIIYNILPKFELIFKDLEIQLPMSASIFIEYGLTFSVISVVLVIITGFLEFTKVSQRVKIIINATESFVGFAVVLIYIFGIELPMLNVVTKIGNQAQ
jgi:type II secretory pathway component PulF